MNDILIHEGVKRRSGRYPWGSGENPYQHEGWFMGRIDTLRKSGMSDAEMAEYFDMSLREFRQQKTLAKVAVRDGKRAEAMRLLDSGMGYTDIGKELGMRESSVRSLLDPVKNARAQELNSTMDLLERHISEKNYIDVGPGVATGLGIADDRLNTAVRGLQNKGYEKYVLRVEQATNPGKFTRITVLAKPGTTYSEVSKNRDQIGYINERFVEPHGTNSVGLEPIKNISSKRIQVVGAESGGSAKDGVIELRRGVDGLDLGDSRYAQVRIGVDGTHYLKGMAIYSDDLPPGVDIRFNSSKSEKLPKMKHLKEQEVGADNPFGSYIKAGGQKGYLNIVREEGDWDTWSKTLSSQMLSKQSQTLAKQQLGAYRLERQKEYEDIMALTNPALRQHLLTEFADKCDRAAIDLKAAALPRQANQVILPMNSLKPNEVYAPNFRNGEKVVLIRHPHGGTFEIPELIVNNNNKEAIKLLGRPRDAIGIHQSVAERLSGADFDGDTVVVIPNNKKSVRSDPALKGLKNFDPKVAYPHIPGAKIMGKEQTQREMGQISNLITDMTLAGAPSEDIVKAVRHSMVVIDAHKKELNYKQSYIDNDIAALKKRYQEGGASTIISKAKSPVYVDERKQWRLSKSSVDPISGAKILQKSGRSYTRPDGTKHFYQQKSSKMGETSDARTLLTKRATPMEHIYADHANQMKALGNKARKSAISVKTTPINAEAKARYISERKSLDRKLADVKIEAPLERKAQAATSAYMFQITQDNPSMTKEQKSKMRSMVLAEQRARVGKAKTTITISDKEWEAIQAGAIGKTKQLAIFNAADQDVIKERAMPRSQKGMTPAKLSLAKARLKMGYTQQQVADSLGISLSALKNALYS